MKRILALLLTLILIAGCGGKSFEEKVINLLDNKLAPQVLEVKKIAEEIGEATQKHSQLSKKLLNSFNPAAQRGLQRQVDQAFKKTQTKTEELKNKKAEIIDKVLKELKIDLKDEQKREMINLQIVKLVQADNTSSNS